MREYRYRLGRLRGRCPACGRRTLKYYIDTTTGEPLDDTCGRCNRQVKCAYHLRPSELRCNADTIGGLTRPLLRARTAAPAPPAMSELEPHLARQNGALLDINPLFARMCRRFDAAMLRRVWMDYGVTHALYGGGSTAFWLRDSQGRIRSAKVMVYDDDGHRLHTPGRAAVVYAHTLLRRKGYVYRACFFGEHIAAARPQATIVLVESEKTALAMAAALTEAGRGEDYAVLATGGASGLNIDPEQMYFSSYRAACLSRRRVVLLPDADMVGTWQEYAAVLRHYASEVTVIDPRQAPYCLSGSDDMADYILSNKTEG